LETEKGEKVMQRWINFISGGGSTNLAVLEAEKPGGILFGFSKTVAIVSSDPDAGGIKKAVEADFPQRHIHVCAPGKDIYGELIEIVENYSPDHFHQLGWAPLTPKAFLARFQGLNQHLGRRALMKVGAASGRDSRRVGRTIPPGFCQRVAEDYDEGDIWRKRGRQRRKSILSDCLLPISISPGREEGRIGVIRSIQSEIRLSGGRE
jgi:hypothetical protein